MTTMLQHTNELEAPQRPARVLIVDDHPAVRDGLAGLLNAQPDLDLVAAAGDAETALKQAKRARPELAVVDYHLRGRDGLAVCRGLKALDSPPGVLIFSAYADTFLAVASVIAGADGLLGKAVLGDDLCEALRKLRRGERVRPPLSRDVLESVVSRLDPADVAIFGMLMRDTPPEDVAAALGLNETALQKRRDAMLIRLRPRVVW